MPRSVLTLALLLWSWPVLACEGELSAWIESLPPRAGHDVMRRVHYRFAEFPADKPCAPIAPEIEAEGTLDAISVVTAARPRVTMPEAMVLVDVGRPGAAAQISKENAALAAKLAREHPSWKFRLIRGDLKQCEISEELTATEVATLDTSVAQLVGPRLPRERLSSMARQLSDPKHPRFLGVISDAPPVWLIREATEWLEGPERIAFDEEVLRKARGDREQDDVADGTKPSAELSRMFRQGRLVLLSRDATFPKDIREQNVARTIARLTPTALEKVFRLHSGFIDIDITALRRLESGHYPLTLTVPGMKAPYVIPLSEPVRPNWEVKLIGSLVNVVVCLALGFLGLVIVLYLIVRDEQRSRAKLWESTRNGAFAFAGAAAAAGIALLPTAETSMHVSAVNATFLLMLGAVALAGMAWAISLNEIEL